MFLSPDSGTPNYDLNTITVTITCYDIIQKDRENLNTIVSDCHQILTDLFGYYNQGGDSDIIALTASQTPLNNYDLDYVSGWSMSVTFELEGWCNNAIPMSPISGGGGCEDATVTLNDDPFNTYASGSTNNITLQDQNSDEITPDSVVGNTITITKSSLGKKLLKTNQTVSYRTGDDGDLQKGREVDFFTLAENNPFGNTNRFTDELGGQTYTNNILIDWSTYNGSEVLGYDIDVNASGQITWNDAIDYCLAFSVGTFTSGWRMPNIKELTNLANYGTTGEYLNYAPFNHTGAPVDFFSSTTEISSTTNCFIFKTNNGNVRTFVKTLTQAVIPCRDFTVTGTTLT